MFLGGLDYPIIADDSKGGYRKDFSNVEAMDIAHKKRTDKETKNLDFQNIQGVNLADYAACLDSVA